MIERESGVSRKNGGTRDDPGAIGAGNGKRSRANGRGSTSRGKAEKEGFRPPVKAPKIRCNWREWRGESYDREKTRLVSIFSWMREWRATVARPAII